MITIIKKSKKFQFENAELGSMDVVYDGIFVRFVDQTEIKFSMSTKPGLGAVIGIVGRCQKDVTVNLDQAEIGNLSNVVVIGGSTNTTSAPVVQEKKESAPITTEEVSKSLLDLYK